MLEVSKRMILCSFLIVCAISIFLLSYGYKFDSFYGVIDSNFEEIGKSSPSKFLYYWDNTRAAGELHSIRFPELLQSTYIYLISLIFSDGTSANFAKLFFVNLLLPITTFLCLYSFTFSKEIKLNKFRLCLIVLLSLFSFLNLPFLQSGMNTLLFQKTAYSCFCLCMFFINYVSYKKTNYVIPIIFSLFTFTTWHQFPYWLPYLFILISYLLFLFSTGVIGGKKFVSILILYAIVSIPSLFSIFYYILSVDISTSNQGAYTQEVFQYANSNSFLLNSFALVAGVNWGRVWFWTGEQFYLYFNEFNENIIYASILYIPIGIFLLSTIINYKVRSILGCILSSIFVIYYFIIPANFGPFGRIYSYAFEKSILFQIYRESHNKILFPVIILICIIVFLASTHKSRLNKLILSLLSLYTLCFIVIILKYSIFSSSAFFQIPSDYKQIANSIDDESTVLVLPSYSNLYSFKYNHYGVSPLSYTIKNPNLLIYYVLQSKYNNIFLDKVLNDFNSISGFGPTARGKIDAQYDFDTIESTNINYIIIDGYVNGIPTFTDENLEGLSNKISHIENFTKKSQVGEIQIYERSSKNGIFLNSNVNYYRIDPTKYYLKIKGVNLSENLKFLQSFDDGWSIYPVEISKQTSYLTSSNNSSKIDYIIEYLSNLKYLFIKDEFSSSHHVLNGYANSWKIESDIIKANYNSKYFHLNDDETYDIELILFYKPQSYLLLTMYISTLLFLIFITVVFKRKYA